MEINYAEIGNRIKTRRKSMELKQYELAEMANISKFYLSNIECGRTVPSLDTILSICSALNITPDYILLGSIRASNVSLNIIENLKLCSNEDLKIISEIISVFVKNKVKESVVD